MVGQRRGLLAYLKKTDLEGYRALIAKLRYQKIINNKKVDGCLSVPAFRKVNKLRQQEPPRPLKSRFFR